jgi:glutathione S-transferase
MTEHPLVLGGWYGSPYSWKMRGVLRYRQIPFRWVVRDSKWDDLPEPPVRIVPVIVFPQPDGSYGEVMVDSSPQIMRLEAEFSGRSIVPTDPAVAFIDALIEDYADEWLTKAMYHYRWASRQHGHRAPDRSPRADRVDRGDCADHRVVLQTRPGRVQRTVLTPGVLPR